MSQCYSNGTSKQNDETNNELEENLTTLEDPCDGERYLLIFIDFFFHSFFGEKRTVQKCMSISKVVTLEK